MTKQEIIRNENVSEDAIQESKNIISNDKGGTNTQYQYSHVDMETVIANPNEYIIPQCLPACRKLWSKNIETYMVSNEEDDNLYVLFDKLSYENVVLFQQLMQSDSRFIFSSFRKTYGIAVKGKDERAVEELSALVDELKMQDTLRFVTADDFLENFKTKGGEMAINEYGYIYRKPNPALANVTLQEALIQSEKEHLYVESEGRVYDSPMYLQWHQRYQQSFQDDLKDNVSMRNK